MVLVRELRFSVFMSNLIMPGVVDNGYTNKAIPYVTLGYDF